MKDLNRLLGTQIECRGMIGLFNSATAPGGPGSSHCRGFTITVRHTRLGRTPLDE